MSIVDLIYPKICVGCGDVGEYICADCARTVRRPAQICPMCCKPSNEGWTHPRCKTKLGMERLMVGLEYKGLVQNVFKKIKYKNAWEMIESLFVIWETKEPSLVEEREEGWVVTAVPMFDQKERERGFNQAEILAKLVAKKNKVRNFVFLERKQRTKAMFGLNKKERKENVKGVFRVRERGKVKSDKLRRVILVDDVWTTGSTMRECSKILKLSKASVVWGVTIAR